MGYLIFSSFGLVIIEPIESTQWCRKFQSAETVCEGNYVYSGLWFKGAENNEAREIMRGVKKIMAFCRSVIGNNY